MIVLIATKYVKGIYTAHVQIHPIFQLAFADCLLSFLWIIGGALWLRDDHNRVGCLVVALLTVVSLLYDYVFSLRSRSFCDGEQLIIF